MVRIWILLCFPIFTDVLSTDRPMQWDQGISLDCRAPSMASNIIVLLQNQCQICISWNLVETRPRSGSNILTVIGFIFCRPVSLDPFIARAKEFYLMCTCVVLVLAAANPFAFFESGKLSQKRGDKWSITASRILWWASATAILTSALLISQWLRKITSNKYTIIADLSWFLPYHQWNCLQVRIP